MSVNKVSTVEAIALVLIVVINRLTISLPQAIIMSCGSAALLNVIYICIIALLFVFLITKLFRRFAGKDIIDISEFLGGKFLKNLVGVVLICYFIFFTFTLLRDFSEILRILYFPDVPITYILAFFIVVCVVANLVGSKSIINSNVLLCFSIIAGIILVCIFVFPSITIQRIFPILGYGAYQTFVVGLSDIFAFNGLVILYLMPPMLENKTDFKKISIISTVIAGLLLILSIVTLLLPFSFSTKIRKITPLYLLLSNNDFGKYVQHPESIFVFTWIISIMSYLNVACLFLLQIVKKLLKVRHVKPLIIPIGILLFLTSLIPQSIMQVRDWWLFAYKYISGPLLFILLPLILIFANIKYKKVHKNDYDVLKE